MDKKTSTILLRVSLEQKELWVGQAHDERVSLSEWIRRRCNGGLGAGEPAAATAPTTDPQGVIPSTQRSSRSSAPAPSSFRPDPKSK